MNLPQRRIEWLQMEARDLAAERREFRWSRQLTRRSVLAILAEEMKQDDLSFKDHKEEVEAIIDAELDKVFTVK